MASRTTRLREESEPRKTPKLIQAESGGADPRILIRRKIVVKQCEVLI